MHTPATIDIAPTPLQARDLSLPLEWDPLLDGGRGGGKSFAVILEVFRRAERWSAQSRTLITRQEQGALSELEQLLAAIQEISKPTSDPARHRDFGADFVDKNGQAAVIVGCGEGPEPTRSGDQRKVQKSPRLGRKRQGADLTA